MSEEIKYVTLLDEEGTEVEFEVVTKLDIEEVEYFIVVPKDADVEEAIALKLINEDGEELFVPVEEENELIMVSEAYEILFEDEE